MDIHIATVTFLLRVPSEKMSADVPNMLASLWEFLSAPETLLISSSLIFQGWLRFVIIDQIGNKYYFEYLNLSIHVYGAFPLLLRLFNLVDSFFLVLPVLC